VCQVLVSLALASPSAATTWALASAEVSSRAVCRPLSSAKHCGLTETATAECSVRGGIVYASTDSGTALLCPLPVRLEAVVAPTEAKPGVGR
jgi:hypothetical protein